jgi:hypothetical protein
LRATAFLAKVVLLKIKILSSSIPIEQIGFRRHLLPW